MLKTIRAFIESEKLLPENSPVGVGLSGGADSVALLHVLVRLGYRCIALHCNFHLRGEESDRDERFSRELAESLDVPFFSIDFDTVAYAEKNRLSIEMAARELRYRWFEEKRIELGMQAIAVAHHRDDSVETVLLNLIRGTGIRGLSGIRPRNGAVVRPLLATDREMILQWLAQENYSYITDSTNLSDLYTRNFIRLRVLPLLEEIQPAVRQTLARSAENLSEVETIYLSFVDEAIRSLFADEERIAIDKLLALPAPKTVLYELLKRYGFNRVVAQEVYRSLTGESGKMFYSPDYRVVKDRNYLLLAKRELCDDETSHTIDSLDDLQILPLALSYEALALSPDFVFEPHKNTAYFDRDKIQFPLTLRRWQKGDWFIPFGMKGKKRLSDYFSDHKYSRIEKENAWVLCCGNDIIWIVGERTDNRFRVDQATKEVLILKKKD